MKILILTLSLILSLNASESVKKTPKQLSNYVVDAKSMSLIKSKDAFFIINSRKYGVMKDTFAFAYERDALAYVKKNGGEVADYEAYIKMDVDINK